MYKFLLLQLLSLHASTGNKKHEIQGILNWQLKFLKGYLKALKGTNSMFMRFLLRHIEKSVSINTSLNPGK